MTYTRFLVELKTGYEGIQRGCSTVSVTALKGDGTADVTETPWMVGSGKDAAQKVASELEGQFPRVPQTHIGFIRISQ
tara:strand:+ start:1108 stop:1341 length:234 start_codon:yes stop_codon:yes gene_type:complete